MYSLFIRDLYDGLLYNPYIYLGRISSPIDPEQPGAFFFIAQLHAPGNPTRRPNRFTLQRAPRDPPEHNGHPDSRPKRSHGRCTPVDPGDVRISYGGCFRRNPANSKPVEVGSSLS